MTASLSDRITNVDTLTKHAKAWDSKELKDEFAKDQNRGDRFSLQAAGLSFDYSKHHIDDEVFAALIAAAKDVKLSDAIKKLLKGDHVNRTEDRPALHTALRFTEAKTEKEKSVQTVLEKLGGLVERVHSGSWKGFTGKRITDVINIGIGGSDLGPRMVTKALTPYHVDAVKVHFVANVDGAEISDLMTALNPETTLCIVASKSFSTLETLENSLTARKWVQDAGCSKEDLAKHFVAVSSKVEKAVDFGIDEDNIYPMYDWVGGRYSLWSAIGMPIALAVGMNNFKALLEGAHEMDKHFAEAPLEKNMPVIMGLLMFWYSNFRGVDTQAVLPYSFHLGLLPSYLQQLEMESNGKCVTNEGVKVDYNTGSVVWGTEGTNGQHSFHQLLHQGTVSVPIDFIATLDAHHDIDHQHKFLFANCVAQSQALMTGRDLEASKAELRTQGASDEEIDYIAPHKVHPGNRPSSVIVMEKLTPATLGALIAAYEHKTYTLSVLWNINAYDQWGVELGKLLGVHVTNAIDSGDIPKDWDSSTRRLIKMFRDQG